jgi:hypothetical protein
VLTHQLETVAIEAGYKRFGWVMDLGVGASSVSRKGAI